MKTLTDWINRLAVAVLIVSFSTGLAVAADPPRIGLPPDETKPLKVFQAIPADAGPDWGVVALNSPKVWDAGNKGKGVKVAVLDTGASLTHPDLKAAYADSKDFTGSRSGTTDIQGHGTHCAGSIGGRGVLPGVAPECSIYAGKVLDDSGSGGVDEIAAGIRHAALVWEVDVISMSLGGPSPDDWIPPALEEAAKKGVIVVCAAGNDGPKENSEGYPGHYPLSLSVAACDKQLAIATFSSRGSNVFVTGPGVNIRSTYPGGQYATMSGTSMATPHVAGLAALWVAAHPEVKKVDRPVKFREFLKAATKFTDRTTARGYGFPDATKLVGNTTPPPVIPVPGGLNLTGADLSAVGSAKLLAAGFDPSSFNLTLKPSTVVTPTAPAVPLEVPSGIGPAWTGPREAIQVGPCPGGVCPAQPQPVPGGVPQRMPMFQGQWYGGNSCPNGQCGTPQQQGWHLGKRLGW